MEGDAATMLREKFVESNAATPTEAHRAKNKENEQSDSSIVHVDQIPAHIPQSGSPAPTPTSLLNSFLSPRKRNFVPFDSETSKAAEKSHKRLLVLLSVGVLAVVLVAVGAGLIVAFAGRLHGEVRRDRQVMATAAPSTLDPSSTTSTASESPTEALNDVLSSLTDTGFFMPAYLYSLGYPSATANGKPLFEAINWYSVGYDARTITAAKVNSFLVKMLPELAKRKAEATHGLPPNVFPLDTLSQRTMWMYMREKRGRIPSLFALLRQSIEGKDVAAEVKDTTHQTQQQLMESAGYEVNTWIHERAIETWVADFWFRHDSATEDYIAHFQADMDLLVSQTLQQEAANGTLPPNAPIDPMIQLTRFLSSHLHYNSPVVTPGYVTTDVKIDFNDDAPSSDGGSTTPTSTSTSSSAVGGGTGKRRRLAARRALLGAGDTQQQKGQGDTGSSGSAEGGTSTSKPSKKPRVFVLPTGNGPAESMPFANELDAYAFPDVTIPVVFHVLSYMDNGYQQPGGAYWDGDNPYQRLVDLVNIRYQQSNVNIQFVLQEARYNVQEFPYLAMANYSIWQQCANQKSECMSLLAEVHNLDVSTVLNVWVGGTVIHSLREEDCKDCVEGYSWTAPYVWAHPPQSTETWPQQHIFLSWDMVDPSTYNNQDSWEFGAYMLAHQFAHFVGLSHSSKGGCEGTGDKDFVADTPNSQRAPLQHLYLTADRWCERMRDGYRGLIVDEMKHYDSCPGDSYMDNIFNLMSEGPLPCALFFTPGQGFLMQVMLKHFRPTMWQGRG